MHYHSMTERWEFDGDPKFLYLNVIFQDGDDYFSAQLSEPVGCPEDLDQSRLEKIPREHIWPLVEDNLTRCLDFENPDVYIKRPRLTGYDGSASLSLYLLQEARTCEILMSNPHENVARYLGCVVKAGRITGLCFQKYAETLGDRLREGRSVNQGICLKHIKAGIDHLHALGLVHNDLHPGNIMFGCRDSDMPVIIDFDSCAVKGNQLPGKRGKLPEGVCTAEFGNDDFALRKLREELDSRKLNEGLVQK
jgi:serine/threonine protein kinase